MNVYERTTRRKIHKLDFNMPFSIFDKINEAERNQQGYRNLNKTIKVKLMNLYETLASNNCRIRILYKLTWNIYRKSMCRATKLFSVNFVTEVIQKSILIRPLKIYNN